VRRRERGRIGVVATSITIALAALAITVVAAVTTITVSWATVPIVIATKALLRRPLLERVVVCLDFLEELFAKLLSVRYTFGTRSTV
jgi:hypothetical protein